MPLHDHRDAHGPLPRPRAHRQTSDRLRDDVQQGARRGAKHGRSSKATASTSSSRDARHRSASTTWADAYEPTSSWSSTKATINSPRGRAGRSADLGAAVLTGRTVATVWDACG